MNVEDASSGRTFEDWRRQSLREVERWLDAWPIYVPDTMGDRDDRPAGDRSTGRGGPADPLRREPPAAR